MDKLDFATGKQAIKEIISNSDQLKAAVAVSEKLAEDLDAQPRNIPNFQKIFLISNNRQVACRSEIRRNIEGFEKTIELTLLKSSVNYLRDFET